MGRIEQENNELFDKLRVALLVDETITFTEVLRQFCDWLDTPYAAEDDEQRQNRWAMQSRFDNLASWTSRLEYK